MEISARHRNSALAERHAAALRREFADVRVYRRNAAGQFSARGQHWTFTTGRRRRIGAPPGPPPPPPQPPVAPPPGPPPAGEVEYVVKTSYKAKKGGGQGGHSGPRATTLTDVRVRVPATWNPARVEQALKDFVDGRPVPGLTVTAFDWTHGRGETAPDPANVADMPRFAAMFHADGVSWDVKRETDADLED